MTIYLNFLPTIKSDVRLSGVDGVLDVLGAPFGGHNDGKDSHGQYFDERTDFLPDAIPYPPGFYYHGAETGSTAEIIADVVDRWVDSSGVWFRAILDTSKELGKRLWSAAKEGKLYASTGAVPASIIVDKATGHIKQWLIGELSLIDYDSSSGRSPANFYAIAVPHVKALGSTVGEQYRHLFDNVYIEDANPPGADDLGINTEGLNMDKLDQILELLQALVDRLTPAGNGEPVGEMSKSKMEETPDSKADCPCGEYDENQKCKCMELDPNQEYPEGQEMESAVIKTKSAGDSALMSRVKQLESQLAARDHAAWVNEQVAAGKITPGEKEGVIGVLSAAYQSGSNATIKAYQRSIEARPAVQPVSGQLSVAGFDGVKSEQEVNEEYMKRLRGYVGANGGTKQ